MILVPVTVTKNKKNRGQSHGKKAGFSDMGGANPQFPQRKNFFFINLAALSRYQNFGVL